MSSEGSGSGGEVEDRFEQAAEYMRNSQNLKLSNEQKLQLYGFFKQAKEGKCTSAKPGFFDFTGRAKWEAWQSLGNMSKEEAQRQYLSTVTTISPNWEETHSISHLKDNKEELEGRGGGGGGGGVGGPVVSRMVNTEEDLPDNEKTIFDWCKEGRKDRLQNLLSPDNINTKDNQGMALMHWACDRGHLNIVDLLSDNGGDINIQDADEQTPLHYASSCDQVDVVTYLLSKGADPSIKDCDDLTPLQVAGDADTRQLFQSLSQ